MRLKDVVVEGLFCGLHTVDECISNYYLHRTMMMPYNSLEYESAELEKEIKAYEAGELKLNWEQIHERVDEMNKSLADYAEKNPPPTDDDWLDFTLDKMV